MVGEDARALAHAQRLGDGGQMQADQHRIGAGDRIARIPEVMLPQPAGREAALVEHMRRLAPLVHQPVFGIGLALVIIDVAVKSHGHFLPGVAVHHGGRLCATGLVVAYAFAAYSVCIDGERETCRRESSPGTEPDIRVTTYDGPGRRSGHAGPCRGPKFRPGARSSRSPPAECAVPTSISCKAATGRSLYRGLLRLVTNWPALLSKSAPELEADYSGKRLEVGSKVMLPPLMPCAVPAIGAKSIPRPPTSA